ncbi:MAG TPA: hypothetical protein P5539_16820 [Mesotoga sp.]|jgi:PHD/YefM family antitoxin component YafN of YafNO toxin-antitoxin module|nr:hypothetical protein [Thermotogaceae bacterium]HON29370.1 hypothetical protein [Mesotoga infera]HRR39029.1 hypothetical protein [Rectinema sp.]HRT39637.1 hypothetical protein [Rectinema sp.]HRV03363.1 hypothetical protein [Mesotoga sp.]
MKEPHMIVNEDGKPVSVILSISTYKKILDDLEELEEIRAYDKAKKSTDEILPFEEALDKFKR